MQLMAGAYKWRLILLNRKDLMALCERASKVTGIPLVEEVEADALERILDSPYILLFYFVLNF